MPDLLALSARIIDSGHRDEPVNRITGDLSEVADGIALVESFSHSVVLRTDDGLVTLDASGPATGTDVAAAVRGWCEAPVHTLVYTHGHLDHVGGSPALGAAARTRGEPAPRVVAHENVPRRFDRYRLTSGYNTVINRRQFGRLRESRMRLAGSDELRPPGGARPEGFLPADVLAPDLLVGEHLALTVGGLDLELHHARGETDDHLWAWVPRHRAVCTGDFLIWNFPNAGNPQKVQRYPAEWAAALRSMAAKGPELLLPAHGLPIAGRERIATVLDEVAGALEHLVTRTLALMNAGATLDTVLHTVSVPEATLARPYLQPLYDEPEFVVRNIWRLYGGWYDGNPARLKPAPDAALAGEVAALAGGVPVLLERAERLLADGDPRLACQLAEWAAGAAPDDPGVHRVRARVYAARKEQESSLMAKGIYSSAARDSAARSTR